MHVYTSKAKNTLKTLTVQRLSQMIRGEHPFQSHRAWRTSFASTCGLGKRRFEITAPTWRKDWDFILAKAHANRSPS